MSLDANTDDDLREALALGDEAAWYSFHQRYTERLIRYARAVIKNDELARDIVQSVMVALVRNRKQLNEVRDFEAYLFSAVRRDLWRALKQERKEAAILVPLDRASVTETAAYETSASHNAMTLVDDRDFLTLALTRLSSEQKMIIELRYFGELTFERIATILELPLGTVVSRFRAGLQQMRAIVEDQA